MRVVKLHRYGVRTYPLREGGLALEAPGKPRLEIAKPLDVTNEIWGPQELLIGSLAQLLRADGTHPDRSRCPIRIKSR